MPRIKVNMVEVAKASARIKIAENAVKDVSDDINYARWRVDDRIAERRGIGSRLNQIINTVNQIESDMENIDNTIIRGASRYSDTENNIVASGREIKNRIRVQIFAAEAAAGALGISKDILKITGIDKVLEKIWDGNQESGKTVPVSNNEKITDVKSNNESVWNQGTDLVGSVAGVGAAASAAEEVKQENEKSTISWGKTYVNGGCNWNGQDYSDYTVLNGFDESFCISQHDSKYTPIFGGYGCTTTADCMLQSITSGVKTEPQYSDWVDGAGAKWTYTNSISGSGNWSTAGKCQRIYQEIMKGNPVIVRVEGHSVTAIGIKNGADAENIKPSDILVIDPGDGKVKNADQIYWGYTYGNHLTMDNAGAWALRIPK